MLIFFQRTTKIAPLADQQVAANLLIYKFRYEINKGKCAFPSKCFPLNEARMKQKIIFKYEESHEVGRFFGSSFSGGFFFSAGGSLLTC